MPKGVVALGGDKLDQCKALANETRLRVLEWLKDPAANFPAALKADALSAGAPSAGAPSAGAPSAGAPSAGAGETGALSAHTGEFAELGVCVGLLQQKAGTSASTMSVHLAILQRAGFVVSTRRGQWTYYRRDEARIRAFCERLHHDL